MKLLNKIRVHYKKKKKSVKKPRLFVVTARLVPSIATAVFGRRVIPQTQIPKSYKNWLTDSVFLS